MARIKVGVSLKSLPWPLRRSLQEAQKLKMVAIEIEAVGDLSPTQLSQSGRREVRHLLSSHGLDLTGLVCPLRHGLDVEENIEKRLDYIRQAMTLSFDLGPHLVILQAGKIPVDEKDLARIRMHESLTSLAQHGDRSGTQLALDTGMDDTDLLAKFLASFDTGSLGVNFNPGNLLVAGFDPYASARTLGSRLRNIHAQDARRVSPNRLATVPLGHGDLDWMQLLGAFEEVDYQAGITVLGDDLAELSAGVQFLRRVIV